MVGLGVGSLENPGRGSPDDFKGLALLWSLDPGKSMAELQTAGMNSSNSWVRAYSYINLRRSQRGETGPQ